MGPDRNVYCGLCGAPANRCRCWMKPGLVGLAIAAVSIVLVLAPACLCSCVNPPEPPPHWVDERGRCTFPWLGESEHTDRALPWHKKENRDG